MKNVLFVCACVYLQQMAMQFDAPQMRQHVSECTQNVHTCVCMYSYA